MLLKLKVCLSSRFDKKKNKPFELFEDKNTIVGNISIKNKINNSSRIFLLKKKKKERVILKAPFHYKTGKHRVIVDERLASVKKIFNFCGSRKPTNVRSVLEFLKDVNTYVPVYNNNYFLIKKGSYNSNFIIKKNFFTINKQQ